MAGLVEVVLPAVLTSLMVWALFRFSRCTPDVDGDGAVPRYGPALAVLGWVCLGIAVVMLGAVAAGELAGESWFVYAVVAGPGLSFGVVGVWLLRAHRSEYVRFSPAGVEGVSGWSRRPVSLRWAEITTARFRSLSGYLTLRAQDGRVVRVSPLLGGSDGLVSVLERRIQADGAAEAVRQFREYQMSYGLAKR